MDEARGGPAAGVGDAARDPREIAAAIARERARLVETQAVANVGSWETDLTTFAVSWSAQTHRIFETDSTRFQPTHQAFLEIVHPDDRAAVDAAFVGSVDRTEPCAIEHRIVMADGRVKVVEERWQVFRDVDGRPARAVGTCRDITAQKATEAALRDSADRLRLAVQSAHVGLWDWDLATNEVTYSPEWKRQLGYEDEEVRNDLGEWERLAHPDDRATTLAQVGRYLERPEGVHTAEFRMRHKDGSWRWILSRGEAFRNEAGTPVRMIGCHLDITERRHLESQLRQSQKLEAIGLLAGGIAHDFNNLLTIITGATNLTLDRLDADSPLRGLIVEVQRAGERAAALTRQLLVFSRRQVVDPKVLDLNAVVGETERLMRRVIGEDILLTFDLSPSPVHVKADAGHLEQVLMNLAVNSRDAMPQGGTLAIATSAVTLEASWCEGHPEIAPGEYVRLVVRDSGHGMDERTLAHAFEPFFTTKAAGKGTGLGLATVHGIVRQAGGTVTVESEVGRGTTFEVFLPQAEAPHREAPAGATTRRMPRGTETLLLAEDEDVLRGLARHVLQSCGYTVLDAPHGAAALAVAAAHDGPIHALVTDVVMPHLGGRELAERLSAQRPGCRVLFLSGYTDDAVLRHGVEESAVAFLQKPFTPLALAEKVREVLDAASPAG